MTTADSALTTRRAAAVKPRSFGRLLAAEARKLVDTRSGFWLLIAMAILAVAMTFANALLMGYVSRDGGPTAGQTLDLNSVATGGAGIMSTFIAVLAILTICGEWTQRTTLTTFALEPRRLRVLLAKVIVVLAVATLLWALAWPMAAIALAVTHAAFHVGVAYSVTMAALFGNFLSMMLGGALMGIAFGLLLQNSAAAIVTYLVLPIALNLVGLVELAFSSFGKVWKWLNPTSAQTPFQAGSWHVADLGPLATSTAMWIVLPVVFGTWRWMRRECK